MGLRRYGKHMVWIREVKCRQGGQWSGHAGYQTNNSLGHAHYDGQHQFQTRISHQNPVETPSITDSVPRWHHSANTPAQTENGGEFPQRVAVETVNLP
jgi:hypothetical protein